MGGPVTVECHSGTAYPDHPIAVVLEGLRLPILCIISESRNPQSRMYRVITETERTFQLSYHEALDTWDILEE